MHDLSFVMFCYHASGGGRGEVSDDVNGDGMRTYGRAAKRAGRSARKRRISLAKLDKAVFLALFVSVLEHYDYLLYGYLASIVFAPLFFPSGDKSVSLIMAFAAFAVGFIARPLGGLFFGHIGDRHGRKRALMLSAVLITISTALIGVLPSYRTIGIFATAGLVLMRLVQGLAMGGENSGLMVFVSEHAPPKRRSLYGAIFQSGGPLVMIIISFLMNLTLNFIDNNQFIEYGWRLLFLFSLVLGSLMFYMRCHIDETPHFNESDEEHPKETPIKSLISKHKKFIAKGVMIQGAVSTLYYSTLVFNISFLKAYASVTTSEITVIGGFGFVVGGISIIVGGLLSDKFGFRRVLIGSFLSTILLSYFSYSLLINQSLLIKLAGQSIISVLFGLSCGCSSVVLYSLFPTRIRYSGVALTHNIATTLFGGLAPMFLTSLITISNNLLMPGYYLMCTATLGLLGIILYKTPKYH